MPPLTERQAAVFEFICAHIDRYKFPPTIREIGDYFGIKSPNGVMCHLRALEEKGVIHRHQGLSRSIVVMT